MRAAPLAGMDALLQQIGVRPEVVPYEAAGAISYFVSWLVGTIALLGLAAVTLWVVPEPIPERVYGTMKNETRRSVALGLVVAVGVPLSILAFSLSVLLVPLAIATALLGPALATAGYVTSGWLIGRALSSRAEQPLDVRGRIMWALAGVAVLRVLSLVPGVDFHVLAIASTLGIGALLATFDRTGSFGPRRARPYEPAPVRLPATYEQPTHA